MAKHFFWIFILFICTCRQSRQPTEESPSLTLSDYANPYEILYLHQNDFYSIQSDGTETTKIRDFHHSTQDFTMNEDHSKIAFAYSPEGYPYEIGAMDRDGSNLQRITYPPTYESKLSPEFIPGKEAIIYHLSGSLYRINLDGSGNQKLLPDSISLPSHYNTSITTDKIVIAGTANKGDIIYIMNIDGSDLNALTDNSIGYSDLSFSPDGMQIIFSAGMTIDWSNSDIFIINRDGTGKINLSNNPYSDRYPRWSPDGSVIYFETYNFKNKYTYINLVNPDGSGFRAIYQKKLKPEIKWFFTAISPDLTRFAYSDKVNDPDSRDTIFIVDIETGTAMKLTAGTFNVIWVDE